MSEPDPRMGHQDIQTTMNVYGMGDDMRTFVDSGRGKPLEAAAPGLLALGRTIEQATGHKPSAVSIPVGLLPHGDLKAMTFLGLRIVPGHSFGLIYPPD